MKTLKSSIALFGSLVFATGLFAQTGATNPTKPASTPAVAAKTGSAPVATHADPRAMSATWTPLDVEKMKRELGLEPDQLTKITDINARFEKEHQALDTQAAGADRMNARLAALEQRRTREVKAVLNAVQLKKWDAAQAGSHTSATVPASHAAPPAPKGTR